MAGRPLLPQESRLHNGDSGGELAMMFRFEVSDDAGINNIQGKQNPQQG